MPHGDKIVPTIRGEAWVCGDNRLILNAGDPFRWDRAVIESDVIVIGAGIIGAACAWQLAKRGQRVTLVDDGNAGATAAGMGHWSVWMTTPPNSPSLPGLWHAGGN